MFIEADRAKGHAALPVLVARLVLEPESDAPPSWPWYLQVANLMDVGARPWTR